jgi:WD40-like Beta Propeller Repeat
VIAAGCGRLDFDQLRDAGGDAPAIAPDANGAACTFGPFGSAATDPTLNSSGTDWGPDLSHDGLTLMFSSDRSSVFQLYQATRGALDQPWSTPVLVDVGAPDGAALYDPAMSSDELTVYYAYSDGSLQQSQRASPTAPWVQGEPVLSNTAAYTLDGGPYISPDGLRFMFTGIGSGSDAWHEYVATRTDATQPFTTATELASIATMAGEGYGSMRGDGLEIVYQDGLTQTILTDATRASLAGDFGDPTQLTQLDDGVAIGDADLSDDGTTLWFTSVAPGTYDLFYATRSCL